MKAAHYLSTDTKISRQMADKIVALLNTYVEKASSVEELVSNLEEATPNGKTQFLVYHALINLAEENGKHRGGSPTLADSILDEQARKVARFGKSAFRMSEKQAEVIVRDAWQWLRPEMRQGA